MTKTDEAAPLVERLRSPWHHADCRAAADEIERLRMDLENTRAEAVLAVSTAQAAERKRLAQRLQAESELDGFGCACTPQRVCGTCTARDTISKALTPLMRELGA